MRAKGFDFRFQLKAKREVEAVLEPVRWQPRMPSLTDFPRAERLKNPEFLSQRIFMHFNSIASSIYEWLC